MIIIDENFPYSQRQLLQSWRVSFKQIGFEIGREGLKDDQIIPLLHELNKPTFFTLDDDFFKQRFCHAQYCLIYLDIAQYESAVFIRRILKHPNFNTRAKRMGNVIRVSHKGLAVWELHGDDKIQVGWQ
jgi:hypothetical protein